MALGIATHKKYIKIASGRFRIEVAPGTEGALQREVTNPSTGEKKTKTELCYDYIEGFITGINYRSHEQYGDSWSIDMKDGDEHYSIQVNAKTRSADDILCRLPNVDFEKKVKFAAYLAGQNKKATGISIYQENGKVENFFVSKEGDKYIYKHGYPELKSGIDKDEYEIQKIQIRKFLKSFILEKVKPAFDKAKEKEVGKTIDDIFDNVPF